jgi:uncharacterized glyoxalase superfamily protein PhnB
MPNVVPMLAYRDGPAAMDWLIEAFGFVERERWLDDEGRLSHGELSTGDGRIMLATPTPLYEGPALHREHCVEAAAWSKVPFVIDGVLVEVDDLDTHLERARAAGARILSEVQVVEGLGFRHYRAEDPEGHRWMFSGT